MEEFNKEDKYHFEGEIIEIPLMLGNLAELNYQIGKAYQFLHTCSEDVQEFLEPVISTAGDTFCELCREFGLDPCEVDFDSYYCGVIYPYEYN